MSEETEIEFSILLTNLREERHKQRRWGMDWTQKGVAKRLGVSRATYNYWENGKADPSRDDLKNIVSDFGLDEKEEAALYRVAAQVPPIIDNLPFQRNPFFTGREEHLERLGKLLQETGSAKITQPVGISGLGGIGKTQLALEYAHRYYPNLYRAALWVHAADEAALQASFDDIAQTLKLPERNEQQLDRRIQAVKVWLKEYTNWLLIMDNADDLSLASSFLPAKPLGHVVFTTQSQFIDTIPRQIEIEAMGPREGLLLLLRRSRGLEDATTLDMFAADIRESAVPLVELLGGHPLALDQAGAYIQETRVSFTDYIKRYQEERSYLLNRRRSRVSKYMEHPEPVAATLELSIKEADEQHPLAIDILHFCAFLMPDYMPEELFQHNDSFMYGTTAFDDAIAALLRYSLIKRNTQEKSFSMHRLVQAVLFDDMSSDLQRQWRVRVVQALDAAFPEPNFNDMARCARLVPQAFLCASWSGYDLPLISEFLRLHLKAIGYFNVRGQYSYAAMFLKRLLSIYEHNFETDHPETVHMMTALAALYHNQGKDEQAELLYLRALPILEKNLGGESLDTAMSMHDLAYIYVVLGKEEQVEALYQQAHAIYEKHLGIEHPLTVSGLCSLGYLYYTQGKFERAEPLLVQALSIWERQLGTDHPETARVLRFLADLYHDQGKFERAEPLYRQAIAIQEKHLGAEHPDNANPLYTLAILLHQQGKHGQAEEMFQRALGIEEQQLGENHPKIQATKRAFATALHMQLYGAEAAAPETDDEPSV